MKPFRKHVAIAVEGGIKGVIVTRALAILEDHLGQSSHEIFRLAAGTSTGSIISAGNGRRLAGWQHPRAHRIRGRTGLQNPQRRDRLGTGDQGQPSATPIVEGREYGRKRSRIP